MAYAKGRVFHDADSHIMELPDFLTAHADPGLREKMPPIGFGAGGKGAEGKLMRFKLEGAAKDEKIARLTGLGDGLIAGPKGYEALGAFDGAERAKALDQLGFAKQLVFSTFAPAAFFDERLDPDVQYGAARAHNRAVADFCGSDKRLIGVAAVPLDHPDRAMAELELALDLGLGGIWVPHRPAGGRSPGHDDFDPFWARLADAGVPFLLHVGGHKLQVPKEWMNNGRPVPTDWLGGGENIRAKDMTSLHHMPETFLSAMILDGVLERHPKLRGGAIELGAAWVPSMLRRLDQIAEIWRKSEPELAKLKRKPSEQATEQLRFTPYPFEDVGAMIRESNDRLYLFSSDYPHTEGGRNPLGRFEASLADASEETRDRFYTRNFVDMCPAAG
ncbi:MAG: amidohydrolase family protein [Parvibaculum sp.]|uniref:amidohydrolase family protein n=1 Tax=Parvibaculum sp. TaxID=2024848 RepID=UPI001D4A01A5|nr:amidohydrolase family protein [Parvibaculum sp.]MBX3488959.1 amidohydrolase family protein [Parvibaculum sp.]MBX3496615.1 amidohydrolase family protein [Parvibaculum sp.]MCW5727172.1 amidohydrolase family protein [Parvibaculum sp.]